MQRVRASKCDVRKVEKREERAFLEDFHLQGFSGSEVCYGLYFENELIELMSFGHPRFNRKKQYRWELIRLCTREDFQVLGGASRLLKHFQEENVDSKSVISYCDLDHFDGKVYEALGFQLKQVTKGYHYEKDGIRYSRQSFMRKNLAKKFNKPEYEDYGKYTEAQIMELEGYARVEDVKGQALYVLRDASRYYTYRLLFSDGSTYIGSHVQNGDEDDYVTSSSYAKEGHEILERKIIGYYCSSAEMYEAEKHQIQMDKAISEKNVNFNSGGRGGYVTVVRRASVKTKVHYSRGEEHSRKVKAGLPEHAWNYGTKGVCKAWNKGLKGLPSSGMSRKVTIGDVEYSSMSKACQALGISVYKLKKLMK